MYRETVTEQKYKYVHGKKLNILIVDDDINSRESLKDMITVMGHKATILDEGLKCVNRCYQNDYDIIFMDYHMNDMNGDITGADIINMVRDYIGNDTVVYAYTGDNSDNVINNIKKNSFDGFFIKPVIPSLIIKFLDIVNGENDNDRKLKMLSMTHKNFMYYSNDHN